MKLSHPEYFAACCNNFGVVEHQQKIIYPQSINIWEAAWLADIITHHTTIHLRKACVDLGTSIAYLTHLLTARFVGFVYCEVFVVESLSELRCFSDSVAGAMESLAETRAVTSGSSILLGRQCRLGRIRCRSPTSMGVSNKRRHHNVEKAHPNFNPHNNWNKPSNKVMAAYVSGLR